MTKSLSFEIEERTLLDGDKDSLWMIKDDVVRAELNNDIDRVLAKYPELPNTVKFRQDLGLIAVASPRFFGEQIPDMDPAIDPIIQSILDSHHSYVKTPEQDLIRTNAIWDWAKKLKIEPKCSSVPGTFGQTCTVGTPVDQTMTNLAITVLDRSGLEWKPTYGFSIANIILRGSLWNDVYKNKSLDIPLLFF